MLFWNPAGATFEENSRYCLLRAIEWGQWPIFVTQPIIPILFLFYPWESVVFGIIIINFLWGFIRKIFISPFLADVGAMLVHLKWFVSIGIGIYFFTQGDNLLAILSIIWPIIVMFAQAISIPAKNGELQIIFLKGMGYEINNEDTNGGIDKNQSLL